MEKTATELMQADVAFRAMVMSAVHEAVSEARAEPYFDPLDIDMELVHDIAGRACMLALKRAFDGNAEIARLRAERDAYKEMALKFSALSPSTPYFLGEKLHSQ